MSIDYIRSSVVTASPDWEKIRNVTEGTNVEQYLRRLKRSDGTVDSKRQKSYEEAAVFYSVAGHTYRGMVGTVFQKEPQLRVPPGLEYLKDNADGRGNNLVQQSKALTGDVIRYGRAGLWVDFPQTEGEVSQADAGRIFATIHRYQPEQIINWRTVTDGAVTRLSLIVLRESEEQITDYEVEDVPLIRELGLDDEGNYFVRLWRQATTDDGNEWIPGPALYPTDAAGQMLREIPFTLVGSENNDPDVDPAPILDLVRVNIGHYRNSADYEDSVFYAGQTQPWMSGADDTIYSLMKDQDFYIGSRMLMPVPSGETFAFADPGSNPLVRQAMMDKVDMMIGLGARFITSGGAGKTDFEARDDSLAQNSILAVIATNVGDAYSEALQWAAAFMGEPEDEVEYRPNNDFSAIAATPAMLAAWVKSYIDGAIPQSDYIRWMKQNGFFDAEKPDEQIIDELNEVITP